MNDKQYVKDLKMGETVDGPFLVVEIKYYKFTSQNREGEKFARILLGDVTGNIKSILWNGKLAEEMSLSPGDVIQVKGEVGEYNGLQVTVSFIKVIPEDQVNRRYFQSSSPREPQEMLETLSSIMDKEITHPKLRLLMAEFFRDKNFSRAYASAPAARKIHHNYIGGLLEHSLEVVENCLLMIKQFPGKLHPSLLLTGAILHDMGKIEEYDLKSLAYNLTDRGKLIGHISIGIEMLRQKCLEVKDFPKDVQMELEHMILSHHGQKEWGSPEVPKTFNAYALFHADLVSARLNQFSGIIEKGQGVEEGWTDWDRLLERSVYLPIPQ